MRLTFTDTSDASTGLSTAKVARVTVVLGGKHALATDAGSFFAWVAGLAANTLAWIYKTRLAYSQAPGKSQHCQLTKGSNSIAI